MQRSFSLKNAIGIALIAGCFASLTSVYAAPISDANNSSVSRGEASILSEAELAQILAPIALYPDTLLTHILIASTYPLEVVEAHRWLQDKTHYEQQQLFDAAENKDWDASVKALLPFAEVIKKLNDDLSWMQSLGEAFLQDEEQVLASIQQLRAQAKAAGSLDDIDNVTVYQREKVIVIESQQPDVIYVPYYDTRVVYGHWHWAAFPPVYWHRPVHYYRHYGPFYWHVGIRVSPYIYVRNVHWHSRHIIVHKSYPTHYPHHRHYKVATSYGAKKWQHNVHHRRGAPYHAKPLHKKYYKGKPYVVRSSNVHKRVSNKLAHRPTIRPQKVHHKPKSHQYASTKVHKGQNVHKPKPSYSTRPSTAKPTYKSSKVPAEHRGTSGKSHQQKKSYQQKKSHQQKSYKKAVDSKPVKQAKKYSHKPSTSSHRVKSSSKMNSSSAKQGRIK